jgi:integrase
LEFCILTATRATEAAGARWSEIDLQSGLWTLPAERTKSGREHRVPLSDPASEILRALPREGDFVFISRPGKPLINMSLLQVLRRMGRGDLTTHGFRSTLRDWAAEQTAYPNELLEMALGHAIKSKAEAAYRRGDLLEKRRRLMADWAGFCGTKFAVGENVVAIRSAGTLA